MRLTGRRFTEEGQPINHFLLAPLVRHWVRTAGLRIVADAAAGHYLPFPGRPPILLIERSRWLDPFGLHALTVAEKPCRAEAAARQRERTVEMTGGRSRSASSWKAARTHGWSRGSAGARAPDGARPRDSRRPRRQPADRRRGHRRPARTGGLRAGGRSASCCAAAAAPCWCRGTAWPRWPPISPRASGDAVLDARVQSGRGVLRDAPRRGLPVLAAHADGASPARPSQRPPRSGLHRPQPAPARRRAPLRSGHACARRPGLRRRPGAVHRPARRASGCEGSAGCRRAGGSFSAAAASRRRRTC